MKYFYVVMFSGLHSGDHQGRTFARLANAMKSARRLASAGWTVTIAEIPR